MAQKRTTRDNSEALLDVQSRPVSALLDTLGQNHGQLYARSAWLLTQLLVEARYREGSERRIVLSQARHLCCILDAVPELKPKMKTLVEDAAELVKAAVLAEEAVSDFIEKG